LVCAALTVAACGSRSGAAPHALPRIPSEIASSAAGPDPASPPPPDRGLSPRRAAAVVVRRYFTESNQLRHHMAAGVLARLFTSECPCLAQARAVRRASLRGQRFFGTTTLSALRASPAGPGRFSVLADYDVSRSGVLNHAGQEILTRPPRRHVRWDFLLRRRAGRWRIYRIVDVS
jgi:hypothetical protein